MPFTPSARGTFSFDTASTSYPEISLDLNGDGSVDDRIVPDEAQLTLAELLATFRNKIETLELQKGVKQSLLKKIAKLEKKIAKGKNKKIEKVLALLVRRISQFEKKVKLSEDDATILKELLDQIDSKL
jgi:hypothetical protein